MPQTQQYELNDMNQSTASTSSTPLSTDELDLEHRTVRKLDLILLPFLSLLFLLNGLDRSNIGNAETAGFSHDTKLKDGDINIAMACFFAFFVALQPLGAALGRKVGMALFVPTCMSIWGLCTILHIFVKSRGQLITLRIVIACLEAGFYPTTVSYLSLFYTRYEFAMRLGFFYGQNAIAGALGGIISWLVFSHFSDEVGSMRSWQFLFLIEGLMTMVVALAGFVWLPHSAAKAWFLNVDERVWAEHRIRADHDQALHVRGHRKPVAVGGDLESHERLLGSTEQERLDNHDSLDHGHAVRISEDADSLRGLTISAVSLTADSGLSRMDLLSAFFQYKIWHLLACNILSSIPATAFGIFLPMVVKQISPDLSPATANLFTAPPFVVGAVTLLIFTRWSDKSQRRILPILCGLAILLLGTAITVIIPMTNYIMRYAGLCILLSGSFIASPLTVAWISNNTPEPGKRAVLLGINGWGNLAGLSSAFLFTPSDAHNGYSTSFLLTLLCVVLSSIGYLLFYWILCLDNSWRESIIAQWSHDQRQREAVVGDVDVAFARLSRLRDRVLMMLGWDEVRRGDERLTYRYTL